MPNLIVSRVQFKNFGPLPDFEWSGLKSINLIVGRNGTGKTLLLKAIYAMLKSLETYRRGCEPRTIDEILSDELYWTFQTGNLDALVGKSNSAKLLFELEINGESLRCQINRGAKNETVAVLSNTCKPRREDSVFFPLNDVLTAYSAIMSTRERYCIFGFDNPSYHLARAASYRVPRRPVPDCFSECREVLREITGGCVEFNETTCSWSFIDSAKNVYPIATTSATVQKLGLLERLLDNRYITSGSVLFFDEPDAGLDSNAIRRLRHVWCLLAEVGVQIFVAASSPFKMFQELDDVATLIL